MPTIRPGNSPVLMIVDVQVGVVDGAWNAQQVVANVARVVERAREHKVPVVWVQHGDDDLKPGSAEWQWAPPLVPATGEAVIGKRFNSAFEQTELDAELARLKATHIVLAGCATNWCIRATAYGALDRGYDLTLVRDAHTTKTLRLEDGVTVEAQSMIVDLNTAMQWLEYPGRVNGTQSVDKLDFGRPGAR